MVHATQGNLEFPFLYKILKLQSFIQPSIISDEETEQATGKTSSLSSWNIPVSYKLLHLQERITSKHNDKPGKKDT